MSEVGAITPPFGMSVFIVKGVVGDKIKMGEIFKGISWFLVCEIVALILLMAFPIISLWLPGKLG
jgi:TRAP-type C4-dicarboxylate transport system permease large subunit